MATGIESDRALGPVVRRVRRWVRIAVSRVGDGLAPEDRRNLDPITVNYAAWREMRRHVREWPRFREAPNLLDVLVSPEDWDDYWSIDIRRKEEAVSTYLRSRAAEKNLWIAGPPRVRVVLDEAMAPGEVEVECHFVAAPHGEAPRPVRVEQKTQSAAPRPRPAPPQARAESPVRERAEVAPEPRRMADDEPGQETMAFSSAEAASRFAPAEGTGSVVLCARGGERIVVRSGDCVGAVTPEDDVPDEVSVRLPGASYPYAEAKHFSLGVLGGRWCLVNHATTGTKVVTRGGHRLMVREPEPYPLDEGDVVFLGPFGPLRFEFS